MSEEEIRQEYEAVDRSKKDPQLSDCCMKNISIAFSISFNTQTDDEDLTADLCSQTFIDSLR